MRQQPDPVYQHARREAIIILCVWALSMIYSCAYCYVFGYERAGHALGPADVRPVWGVPSWVFWGVLAPWAVCAAFTFWFAGYFMADDELGKDHAAELEEDIRERGAR